MQPIPPCRPLRILAVAAALLLCACSDRTTWFEDVTAAAGITFTHESGRTGHYRYLELVGAGVALFDYDGDGWLDIYFVNGNHITKPPSPAITNVLYRNNRDGTFTDVTQRAGVGDPGYGQGCCAADYDNDGDQDLYVTNYGPDRLYRNEGDGTFTEVTAAAGIDSPGFGQSCAWFDFDGDGFLDLYVQNYIDYRDRLAGMEKGGRTEYPGPVIFTGAPDLLFRNNGDGTFTEVGRKTGIHRPEDRGMGLACVDLDGDGDADIFVANDAMPNAFFANNGDGTFTDRSLPSGLALDSAGHPESSMGVAVGDVDGDGRLDIACPALRREGCTLYLNRGGGTFEDASVATGVHAATDRHTGFSPNLLDADNDGDLDLFVCNGGVARNPDLPKDAPYAARYGAPDVLLRNDSRGRFAPVDAGPHFARALIGRGSAAGDLDNDGDVDLVVNNLGDRPVVLRNRAPQGNWITLLLVPAGGNRDAIGARVEVTADGRTQVAVVRGGGGYLSLDDRRPHFGLGAATRVERLRIRWPDGGEQVLADVGVNRFVTVRQER